MMASMRSFISTLGSSSRTSLSLRQSLGRNIRPLSAPRVVARRTYSTRESAGRDRSQVGPVTWKAGLLFIITGTGLYFYFEHEKDKIRQKKIAEQAAKSIGKPSIGGPFNLIDANGKPFTEQDLRGKWTLMYFGFTHCPDICPEELDKMGMAVDLLEKKHGQGAVLPVFISVDPARDSVEQVKTYIQDFHPRMIGLTGDYESVKRACKSYRVYFSSPPNVTPGEDYLVDHSIFFYLMDPLGQFVDAFGKATSAHEVSVKTSEAMKRWEAAGGHEAAGLKRP